MSEENLETIIDRLSEFVLLKGKTSVREAAQSLGLPSSQVERLALLLQDSGMLEVRYGILEIELVAKKEAAQFKRAPASSAKGQSKDKGAQLAKDIAETQNIFAFVEQDLERRIASAEALVRELEKEPSLTEDEVAFLRKELAGILQQLKTFQTALATVGHKEEALNAEIARYRDSLDSLEKKAKRSDQGYLETLKQHAERSNIHTKTDEPVELTKELSRMNEKETAETLAGAASRGEVTEAPKEPSEPEVESLQSKKEEVAADVAQFAQAVRDSSFRGKDDVIMPSSSPEDARESAERLDKLIEAVKRSRMKSEGREVKETRERESAPAAPKERKPRKKVK